MKRFLSFLLIAILLLCVGCSDTDTNTPSRVDIEFSNEESSNTTSNENFTDASDNSNGHINIDDDASSNSETPTDTSSDAFNEPSNEVSDEQSTPPNDTEFDINTLSHELFDGVNAYVLINDGKPFFTNDEITTKSFETYGNLDNLGRCTYTFACVGKDIMPTGDRESISSVRPSGWDYNGKSNNKQYDFVDGKYLYNRCHLIGYQLTGENANEKNLITGTRYLNIEGMLTFENMIADAVKENDLHVMYRVTPVYKGNNLLAEGVLIEAYSVEDKGETIELCFFSFNVQPGVQINYKTGENSLDGTIRDTEESTTNSENDSEYTEYEYILNTNSKKFHNPDCSSVDKMNPANKEEYEGTREDLIEDGYEPCGICKP